MWGGKVSELCVGRVGVVWRKMMKEIRVGTRWGNFWG